MIIDCLNGEPVKIDGEPVLQNIRINITPGERKFRIQAELLDDSGNAHPIDVIIMGYGNPKFGANMVASISAFGIDNIHSKSFRLNVSYEILRHSSTVTGQYGSKTFSHRVSAKGGIEDIIALAKMFVD